VLTIASIASSLAFSYYKTASEALAARSVAISFACTSKIAADSSPE